MGWLGSLAARNPQYQQNKEILWTQKQAGKEAAWAQGHPTSASIQDQLDPSIVQMLKDALAAGTFSPTGSPALMNALRQQMIGDSGARQRQAGLAANLYGNGDPSLSGYAGLQSVLGGAHDMHAGLSDALTKSILQNQGWLQGLQSGVNSDLFNAKTNLLFGNQNQWNQQDMANRQQKAAGANFWGGLLGKGLGIGLGALTGGASGAAMGGGGFNPLAMTGMNADQLTYYQPQNRR